MSYSEQKVKFNEEHEQTPAYEVMQKATKLVNSAGKDFLEMDGTDLYNMRARLSSYKFYLSDFIHDYNRAAKAIKIEIKQIKARNWTQVSDEIKAKEGKVSNKQQIENVLEVKTEELQHNQVLYETLYYTYNLKISSIDDVITAISQRIKALQKEAEQAMYAQ